ncbi:hypothetical protein GCM10023314_09430 [Algibacter agarivorans]|uniref:Uncharacterized protein n=1 Tax=Algibacter agarivorans TaxID=1109741 RepID=A0ABP9GD74_9FLAO
MKYLNPRHLVLFILLSVFISPLLSQKLEAQDKKKIKLRIKADYTKVIDHSSFIDLSTIAKINKKNAGIANLNLTIISKTDDDEVELGQATTNHDGKVRFLINDLNKLLKDTLGFYNLRVKFMGDDSFKKASKTLSFKDAHIETKSFTKDSVNYVSATLKDVHSDSVLTKTSLKVNVERLFKSLPIGEQFNYTDENGTILVPIERGIPCIDGKLVIEVILNDSDDYGTVKALVNTTFGKSAVIDNSFENRTLWSPRNKTPIFILIFANLLIFTIWGIIIYLITNLFRINKS